ncbi:OmpA family protein [Azospirillum argentinense]
MKKRVALCGAIALLASCVTNQQKAQMIWAKQGAAPQDLKADIAKCDYEVSLAVPPAQYHPFSSNPFVILQDNINISDTENRLRTLMQKCMFARGWSATPLLIIGDADRLSMGLSGKAADLEKELMINVGDRVFFSPGSAVLVNEAKTILDRQVTFLKQHPSSKITVEGHASDEGSEEDLMNISRQRAEIVRNYLEGKGIDSLRISTAVFGGSAPNAPGGTITDAMVNRRAVTAIRSN